MPQYGEGDWVIDTKRRSAPTVACVLPYGTRQLYVLQDGDGDYYIEDEDHLIPYDKHYLEGEGAGHDT